MLRVEQTGSKVAFHAPELMVSEHVHGTRVCVQQGWCTQRGSGLLGELAALRSG